MNTRYLLYIDLLGFSELVTKGSLYVRRVYKIIEGLNAHHHEAFRVIVFSDTILIYNIHDAWLERDRSYYVMFLIEFAQNLLYEFAGKKLFFRALLVAGEFEHITVGRFEKFFGRALVNAYLKEKTIKCAGLFIDQASQQHNDIFPVATFDREVSFVFLNQSLEELHNGTLGEFPIEPGLLFQTDSQWHLAKDVYFLRDIYLQLQKHSDPGVRKKMESTWGFFYARYPKLLDALIARDFSLDVISKGFDWSQATARIKEGYRGFGEEQFTIADLGQLVHEAQRAGSIAASAKYAEMSAGRESSKYMLGPCGGAHIILDVDGRSHMARLLKRGAKEIPDFSVRRWYDGGYAVRIDQLHHHQERDVDIAAKTAILTLLEERLGVVGHVLPYFD